MLPPLAQALPVRRAVARLRAVPLRVVRPLAVLLPAVLLQPVRLLDAQRRPVLLQRAPHQLAKHLVARLLPDGRVLECGWRVVPPSSSDHTLFQVTINKLVSAS